MASKKEEIRRIQQATAKRTFFLLPTLDRYVLREFLIPFSILLFAFTFLFLIGDIFNDLSDFLEYKATFAVTARYFLLKIPGNIRFILPISVLLACMYTLANFGRNKEITAMRSSGLSLIRCGFSIFCVGFVVMLVNFWFNEQLVPYTEQEAVLIWEKLSNPRYEETMYNMLQYRSADKLRDWLFQNFDQRGIQHNVILKKYIYQDKEKVLEWDIRASQAKYDPRTGWHFFNVTRTPYHRQLRLPGNPEKFKELVIPSSEIPEYPEDIVNAVKPPEELPSWVIYNMLQDNASMVPALRNMYETILYYRMAFSTVCFLCVFLGLPLAAKNERAGIFLSIITAVGVVVVYQLLTEIFLVLGKQGFVPPIVGGLAPTAAFVFYSWFFVIRKSG
ncbi:MAG: LptF/LptG family permease [Lentisphaeria bacterium]|nr:LptF/LptG family permease [Lentisphaeria bacterium]